MYQEINLCTNLSVGENVMLGHEPAGADGSTGRLFIDWRPSILRAWGSPSTPDRCSPTTRSPFSNWSRSAAMVLDAKVLVLDEPTSSLDRGEVEQLFSVIRDCGKGVRIFVSHFLDQVYEIADRITVLRNGKLVGEYLVKRPATR